ncbi:MAG TPA: DUF4365 domain-containing protein [Solirubrobacteraceae bacterium]
MPGTSEEGKERSDTASTGAAGFSLASLRFEKADGQLLHQTAREEVGIDGVLELRDKRKKAYGALLLVQIKAFEDIDSTGSTLRYVVKPVDAAYAEYQPLPFLLVIADKESEKVWWKCLQDAWADPARRATRAVDFDRDHDRLMPDSGDALREVFERHRPRHDRATRPVLGSPFHEYGAGPEYDAAAALSLTDAREQAADAWWAVAAALNKRDDVPLVLRIALLERLRGAELGARRTGSSAQLRLEIAEAKLDGDLAGAAHELDAAPLYAALDDDPHYQRLLARARAVHGDLDRLRALAARPPRRVADRRPVDQALCEALLLRGDPGGAARAARATLPPTRLTGARMIALAVDELDASEQLGETGRWTWEDLVELAARAGPELHATVLQRLAVSHARRGETRDARAVFQTAAGVWADVPGADEQVGEALLSGDLVAQYEGRLMGALPDGARDLILQLGGSEDVPAARAERYISSALARILHAPAENDEHALTRRDEALDGAAELLLLAATIHRRAGNFAGLRRTFGHLARLADVRGRPAEALRWSVLVGASREAAARAVQVGKPVDVLAQLQLTLNAAPWELDASLAAVEAIADNLNRRQIASMTSLLLAGAEGTRALPGAVHHAVGVLARVSDRLPEWHAEKAVAVLTDAMLWDGPTEQAAANGLASLLERGHDQAGRALFDAILDGRDLPVLIHRWIADADPDTQQRLVDAATDGSHEALTQAVAGGLPKQHPELRALVDDTITRRLDAVPAGAYGRDGINGWDEAARFAAHASANVRDALIDRAAEVLADDAQDDRAVVTALVTFARVAVADPPVIAPARATELYDEIAGLARGEPRRGPPSSPYARPLEKGLLQASAVRACIFLAALSNGARTEVAQALLKLTLRSTSSEVRRTAKRLASTLDDD